MRDLNNTAGGAMIGLVIGGEMALAIAVMIFLAAANILAEYL